MKVKERYNWPVTILLIIGIVLVILLPLYMALMIAIKDPTDMNNILALPRKIRLQNFADAWVMTNFPELFNTAFITFFTDHKLFCRLCQSQETIKKGAKTLFPHVLLLYQCHVYTVPGNHASAGCAGKCFSPGKNNTFLYIIFGLFAYEYIPYWGSKGNPGGTKQGTGQIPFQIFSSFSGSEAYHSYSSNCFLHVDLE